MRLTRNSRAEVYRGASAALPDISLVGAPLAIIAENGDIFRVNADLGALTGFSEHELKDMPLDLIIKGAKTATESISRGKGAIATKTGQEVLICYSISPVRGSGFSVLTVIPRTEEERLKAELASRDEELRNREKYISCFRDGVFRMITDLDRSETALKDALKDLQDTQVQLVQSSKMKALGELAASLVHEISQPLTVIRGLTHGMLRAMEEGAPWRDKMRLISEASLRMEKIVKHLKTFSRSDPPVLSPVDVNSIVRDAFMILNEHLLSHSIETVLDLGTLPLAMGNPSRLEQVVINLVSNARDAMPRGGVITISTKAEDDGAKPFIRLTVRDSGAGIPGDIIGRVFDPFFTTKETGKGTGLGLSISLSIVREHKGDIRVESAPGAGTSFHVLLPSISAG